MASTFGPRVPWVTGVPPGIFEWTPDKDTWELYNLEEDWTQANDLAGELPEKLAEMKDLWLIEATKNNALPIGGGFWILLYHPEYVPAPPYTDGPSSATPSACRSSPPRSWVRGRTS